jgi:hypothetical protein
MRFRVPRRDNLVAHVLWERDIDQPIAVHVPEFSLTQPELKATEPVWCNGDILPPADDLANAVLCSSS